MTIILVVVIMWFLGILQALLWAKQQGGQEPFALCYDSMYAANITSGLWKPKTNKGIASLCHEHFLAESERRKGGVHLIHIKGHSDQLGNEKADERVQWGKENGPYCRFRLDGTSGRSPPRWRPGLARTRPYYRSADPHYYKCVLWLCPKFRL